MVFFFSYDCVIRGYSWLGMWVKPNIIRHEQTTYIYASERFLRFPFAKLQYDGKIKKYINHKGELKAHTKK